MKKLTLALSALAITVVASTAQASVVDRIDTHQMNTSQVKELIQDRGAAILSTGPGLFDRYVSNSSQCTVGEVLAPAYIPTADSSSAFVGYTCDVEYSNN